MDMDHFWAAVAAAFALLLAGVAFFCLHLTQRDTGRRKRIDPGPAALRRTYDAGRRKSAPPALIYVEVSQNVPKPRREAGPSSAGKFLRERLLGWSRREDGVQAAEAGGGDLLLLSGMAPADFLRRCSALADAWTRQAQEQGGGDPHTLHFGYYRDKGLVKFEEAARRARLACRCAALDGKACGVYDFGRAHLLERAEKLEDHVMRSIRENRFLLEFQPFVSLTDGRAAGGEVLARMQGQERGLVMPGRFLSAVDTIDAHGQFDEYVFQKACAWLSCQLEKKEVRFLSCNFSRRTMESARFVPVVRETAARYGLPHGMIALEVTEEEQAESSEAMRENLRQLHEEGFLIFLDDFGAGVTTLAELWQLPIDVVKMDKGLLDAAETERGRLLFCDLVRLAKDLGCLVLCEGIERAEQAELARGAGCALAQGYYFSAPVSAADFLALLPDARATKEQAAAGQGRRT